MLPMRHIDTPRATQPMLRKAAPELTHWDAAPKPSKLPLPARNTRAGHSKCHGYAVALEFNLR